LLLPLNHLRFSYWEDGNEGPIYKIRIWLEFFSLQIWCLVFSISVLQTWGLLLWLWGHSGIGFIFSWHLPPCRLCRWMRCRLVNFYILMEYKEHFFLMEKKIGVCN
jgi:hypothetical protein